MFIYLKKDEDYIIYRMFLGSILWKMGLPNQEDCCNQRKITGKDCKRLHEELIKSEQNHIEEDLLRPLHDTLRTMCNGLGFNDAQAAWQAGHEHHAGRAGEAWKAPKIPC